MQHSSFSKSTFITSTFNLELNPLYNFMTLDYQSVASYSEIWYQYFNFSLNKSIRKKRFRRLNVSINYSSHTIHILNQKQTNSRKLSKEWSLLLAKKDASLTKEFSFSIELDKLLFREKFELESSN